MRIWLDDLRPMPDGFDVWTKTAKETLLLVQTGEVDFISFDHDLGYGEDDEFNNTGYAVARAIELWTFYDKLDYPIGYEIHSMNPVGSNFIKLAMDSSHDILRKKVKK